MCGLCLPPFQRTPEVSSHKLVLKHVSQLCITVSLKARQEVTEIRGVGGSFFNTCYEQEPDQYLLVVLDLFLKSVFLSFLINTVIVHEMSHHDLACHIDVQLQMNTSEFHFFFSNYVWALHSRISCLGSIKSVCQCMSLNV